ncbi:MAG: 3-deoxy-7-phosphoheptulonate synthase, partial [Verrucomicrobia bacterium]|nr:3-deoxy-7-phosphoheptulonate synthase [Verrucomicrobiota bacterium]
QDGVTSIVRTTGNPVGHIVLRGGKNKPNYDESSIIATEEILQKAGLPGVLMVDCSHDNSGKQHLRQKDAWENVINQRINGRRSIIGLMLESFLREGNQNITDNLEDLEYGVSVTDSCLDWDSTETLLRTGYEKLGARP